MRLAAGLVLAALAWQAPGRVAPEPRHFAFERGIEAPAGSSGRVCAALDGSVYAHSDALMDVRLYAGGEEVPYALMTSQATAEREPARVVNLGERDGRITFDLAMPARAYTTVDLGLRGENFLATAKVWGMQVPSGMACCSAKTELGTFTLFDLTAQRLGRSTALPLAESTFPLLHVELEVKPAPGSTNFKATPAMVTGAEVPPSREAQTIYTTVAETTAIVQKDGRSVASFTLPAHVPVERVSFEMQPGDRTNFSRGVEVKARAEGEGAIDEDVAGEIARVRMTEAGREIHEEQLSVPATLGSNGDTGAKVEVAVENGDDKPLAIRAVKLEMRERRICFDARAQPVKMYYGDEKLAAPVYDYARLFRLKDAAAAGRLDAEARNAGFAARDEQRTLTDRHPELVWVALLAVIAVLGVVAFRSARRM